VRREYDDCLAGKYTLTANEIDQIGYRFDRELGHRAVYPVDADGDSPWQRLVDYGKASARRVTYPELCNSAPRLGAKEAGVLWALWALTKRRAHPMRQLNFAAAPDYGQPFREVQRLFRQDVAVPIQARVRALLEQTMRDAVANQVQADWHERRPGRRRDYRNGSYQRRLLTTVGMVVLDVPRTRDHPTPVTEVVGRYPRRMPEIDEMLRQVFLRGVSTRQAGAVLTALCGTSVSATAVSRLTALLERSAQAYHEHPLEDRYRYLLMEGVYLRIREAGGVKRRVALCVYGVTGDGLREMIDFRIARAESQTAWEALLRSLYERGLCGAALKLIVSDGGTGLQAAIEIVYPRVPRQLCWAHKVRNVLDKVRECDHAACARGLAAIYRAESRAAARRAARRWADRWLEVVPAAVRCLQRDLEELVRFFDCPAALWPTLRTTNLIERSFVEVRRRVRPMTLFATPASSDRILFAIFVRLNEGWRTHPLPAFTQLA
jgi:putative transposase